MGSGSITDAMQGSPALQLIISQGWDWRNGTQPNIELETCPYCKKGGFGHFYLEIHGLQDEQANRDGLHYCQRCGKSGNLYALRTHLGLANPSVDSTKAWGAKHAKTDPLPDPESCHQALLADPDALYYLETVRGLSSGVLAQMKVGLKDKHYFKGQGEIKAIVFPYLMNGNCVYAHYRSLPDVHEPGKIPKLFNSPKGWDAVLYNSGIIRDGMKEIIFVEGEMDTLSLLDNGIDNVVGVPGANIRKAEWLEQLDKLELDRIYILYDSDKVGQRAAQALASKIGIERCWKIVLPSFVFTDDEGKLKEGKDINEWFRYGGGTIEAFQKLKEDAEQFDVDGVTSAIDALDEFEEELEGKGSGQKYETPWPSLSKIIRFDEGDVIDIIAEEKIGKTTFGLNLMEFVVDRYGEDGVIICLEMTRARLARKWLSHKTRIPDSLATTKEEDDELTKQFKTAIPILKGLAANRDGNLYFCYPKFRTVDDIYKLMIDCIRRYGVKWIMFDNLQLLCDRTLGNQNRTQHLSSISKSLQTIAKEYNIQMVRILQPHRIAAGKLATTDDVDGSSQVAKDCDCMIALNRARIGEITKDVLEDGGYIHSVGTFSNDLLVNVGLSRYSAGGKTTLYYDGACSSVYELTQGKIEEMNAKIKQFAQGSWGNVMASLDKLPVAVSSDMSTELLTV